MILVLIVAVPLVGGLLAWAAGRGRPAAARQVALVTSVVEVGLVLAMWLGVWAFSGQGVAGPPVPGAPIPAAGPASHGWMAEARWSWVPSLGIYFHLAADGLSALLLTLTAVLGLLAVLVGWADVRKQVAFYHMILLWIISGVAGVFLAVDLFLFYFFWELMLVPMYLLIAIWGYGNRTYSAIKFFVFTQASGLLMLVSILGLAFLHRQATGVLSFDYDDLLALDIPGNMQMWLMLGFWIAFAVKMPVVPLHTWLPDAHTDAPTAGSLDLAGLVLKTGPFGMLRFALPLFPSASAAWAPVAVTLGVVAVIYGALLAFGQRDLKRLVAYTSISHLGFVLLGIYSFNELALQGSIFELLAHGLSTGGLFVMVGLLQERTHTRDLNDLGGLWESASRLGGVSLLLAMASLGLPGLGNFVAEFLILVGSWTSWPGWTIAATVGLVANTIYAVWLIQRVYHGPNLRAWRLPGLMAREWVMLVVMIGGLIWLGLFPQPVLNASRPMAERLNASWLWTHEPPAPEVGR